jgi:hypothetical protein
MQAKNLKPGDIFTVDPPDFESPIRVCLTNDEVYGLRFGWPGLRKEYWCYMGELCEVELRNDLKVDKVLKCSLK